MRNNSHYLTKEAAGILSSLLGAGKSTAGATTDVYNDIVNIGWGLTLPVGLLGAVALSKMTTPSAVAKNADGYMINETLRTSLAKSMRDRDKLRERLAMEAMSGSKLPSHDRFI